MAWIFGVYRSMVTNSDLPLHQETTLSTTRPVYRASRERLKPGDNELSSLERFLRLANHELRGPLTAVRVQSQLGNRYLQRGNMQRVAESLHMIEEQSFIMERMLKDLLVVAKMREGRYTIQPVRTNLVRLSHQCIAAQQSATGRVFVPHLPDSPIHIEADPDALQCALCHMLLNAVLYSPAEKEVEVNVWQTHCKAGREHAAQARQTTQPAHAMISIRDEGPGIVADELNVIFEQFYRGSAGRESETSGLGLGLALSREIVRQHRGDLWVTSEQPGGSTFFVMLPVAPNES